MAYYSKCSQCGAHLDPGEHCDCEREKRRGHKQQGATHANIKAKGGSEIDRKTKAKRAL